MPLNPPTITSVYDNSGQYQYFLTNTGPDNPSPTTTDDHTPTISGTAGAGTVQVQIWVDYDTPDFVSHHVLLGVATPVGGNWSFEPSMGDDAFLGLYTFSATAKDASNHVSAPSNTFDVQIEPIGSPEPACFLAGTLIATVAGERPIESLATGDMIALADGTQKPIKWVGRMTVDLHRFNRHIASPILIRAGALGGGLPKRDLYTSYRHGFAVNGVLVIAGMLVNGTSIVQCSDWKEPTVTFYQIEVEGHELMVVEGAAAETFGEDGDNRELFDNAAEFHVMYPDAVAAEPMPMGRVITARQIPRAVKATIETAAVEMGYLTLAAAA